jgi:LysM repeat protein
MKQFQFWIIFTALGVLVFPLRGLAQVDTTRVQMAQMVQDVQMLKQEVQRLKLQVSLMEEKNRELAKVLESQQKYLVDMRASVITLSELQSQVAGVKKDVLDELQRSQKSLVDQVNRQLEGMAKRTDDALAQMAKTINSRPQVTTVRPAEDYPRTGTTHTIARGDTLTSIASRYGAKINHIRSANSITNDTALKVGDTLFIPIESTN